MTTAPANPAEQVRLYKCPNCKAQCVRPHVDPKVVGVPHPKPCDHCGWALNTTPFALTTAGAIADTVRRATEKADTLRAAAAGELLPVVSTALAAARSLVSSLHGNNSPAAIMAAANELDRLLKSAGV